MTTINLTDLQALNACQDQYDKLATYLNPATSFQVGPTEVDGFVTEGCNVVWLLRMLTRANQVALVQTWFARAMAGADPLPAWKALVDTTLSTLSTDGLEDLVSTLVAARLVGDEAERIRAGAGRAACVFVQMLAVQTKDADHMHEVSHYLLRLARLTSQAAESAEALQQAHDVGALLTTQGTVDLTP